MNKDIELGACSQKEMPALFAKWAASRNAGGTTAFFGRGLDFQLMEGACPGLRDSAAAIVDESGAAGCLSVAEATALKPDFIVVASMTHQESMRRKLRAAGYDGTVVLPYESDPELGTLKLRAYDASLDWPKPGEKGFERRDKRCPKIRRAFLFQPPFAKANARHKKTMPLGLLYVAAALRASHPEIELELYDAHIARDSWEDARKRVDASRFDLFLCSCWSAQASPAFLMADYVRETKGALTVMGGVHPMLSQEDTKRHCDVLIVGEGERQVPALVDHVERFGSFEGFQPDSSFIEDLDSLPFPAWDLLADPKAYDHPMHVVGGWRFPLVGSRGCPFNCSFCSSPLIWKRRVRWRSPENVVAEMRAANERFGVSKFHFWDDNFLMNERYAEGLCDALLKSGLGFQWCGLSRASDIVRNSKLIPLLKKAGCVGLEIGVESFSDQVSKAVDKGEFAGETERAADALLSSGVAALYTHMLFVPGETLSSYRAKDEFLRRLSSGLTRALKSDSDLGQLTTPHIGTRFSQEAPALGEVFWKSPDDSFHHRVNFIPNSLLDDVPSLAPGALMPDPLPWLSSVSQAIIDWTEEDMRGFLRSAPAAWSLIDGSRSVRSIATALSNSSGLPLAKALLFVSLRMVAWARDGLVSGRSA